MKHAAVRETQICAEANVILEGDQEKRGCSGAGRDLGGIGPGVEDSKWHQRNKELNNYYNVCFRVTYHHFFRTHK
jgi:hypothetical protein